MSIRNYAEDCQTDRVAYLEGWYVDAEWRRRGVGSALVAGAEAWARAQGCTEVRVGRAIGERDERGRAPGARVSGDRADSLLSKAPGVTPDLATATGDWRLRLATATDDCD